MGLIFKQGLSFSGFERDHLYWNRQGRSFLDISGVSGIDSLSDGRSAVLGDFDNDGDLDVFLTTIQGEGHLLFRNNVGQDRHFIRVALEGRQSGRDAFGAVVRVRTSRGLQTRIKGGGEGFLAQHDPRLLFGLAEDEKILSLEVTWPSGARQRMGPLPAGVSVRVVEGKKEYLRLQDPPARLPRPLSEEELSWSKLALRRGSAWPRLRLQPLGSAPPGGVPRPGRTLVNFWATWCGPCRQEMPRLEQLRARLAAQGIHLVGISLDRDVSGAEVARFAARLGVHYPLYILDPKDLGKIFARGQVFVPLSILLDETGRAVDLFVGWNRENEQRLERLLESGPR